MGASFIMYVARTIQVNISEITDIALDNFIVDKGEIFAEVFLLL